MGEAFDKEMKRLEEQETQRIKEAIHLCHKPGMDQKALVSAVMRHLRGHAVPWQVAELATEFLKLSQNVG